MKYIMSLNRLYFMMLYTNGMMIILYTLFLAVTTQSIGMGLLGDPFINGVDFIPYSSTSMTVIIFTTSTLLFFLLLPGEKEKGTSVYAIVKLCGQLLLCYIIMKFSYYQYRGVVYLVVLNYFHYQKKLKSTRYIYILLLMLLFMLSMDYFPLKIISRQFFLDFYQPSQERIIRLVLDTGASLTNLLFILYMLYLFKFQWIENERVSKLNKELDMSNEQLLKANLTLKELAEEKEQIGKTKERNRLAREIHDTLGHTLTGINAGIDAIRVLMEYDGEEAKKQLEIIGGLSRRGIEDVRRSVKALRPDALERYELADAIRIMLKDYSEFAHINFDISEMGILEELDDDEEDTVFRLVQECVTNSIRHGKASHIDINVSKRYNILTMTIVDDGQGCKDIKEGFGLMHMNERIHMLKGTIHYTHEEGFKVIAKIPIRWGNHD